MFIAPKPPQTKMQHQTLSFKRLLSPPSVSPPARLPWLCGEAQCEDQFVHLGNRIPESLPSSITPHLVLSCVVFYTALHFPWSMTDDLSLQDGQPQSVRSHQACQ